MRTLLTVWSASAPCTPAPFDPPPPLWIFIERGLSSPRAAVIVLIWQRRRKKRYPPPPPTHSHTAAARLLLVMYPQWVMADHLGGDFKVVL